MLSNCVRLRLIRGVKGRDGTLMMENQREKQMEKVMQIAAEGLYRVCLGSYRGHQPVIL